MRKKKRVRNVDVETTDIRFISDAFRKRKVRRHSTKMIVGDDGANMFFRRAMTSFSMSDSVKSELYGRSDQVKQLKEGIRESLETQQSRFIYVSGSPGTGKTASLRAICREIEGESDVTVTHINCMMYRSVLSVVEHICSELGCAFEKRKGVYEGVRVLKRKFCGEEKKNKELCLIVLDEIDGLVQGQSLNRRRRSGRTAKLDELYTLLSVVDSPISRVVLVGVANALDLTERLLPNINFKYAELARVQFPPYSHTEILCVLNERIRHASGANTDEELRKYFNPSAVEMIARRVSASSGDVRKAFEVSNHSVEVCRRRVMKSGSRQGESLVALSDVATALKELMGSTLLRSVGSLPPMQQFLLCVIVKMTEEGNIREGGGVSFSDLRESHIQLVRKSLLPKTNAANFGELVDALEGCGLITWTRPRAHSSFDFERTEVRTNVPLEDLRLSLGNHALCKPLLK